MNDSIFPNPQTTALLVVDLQARLLPAMGDAAPHLLKQNHVMVETAASFGWPIFYSEQYPEGLGRTEETLAQRLEAVGARRFEKLEFSLVRNAAFVEAALPSLPNNVIVTGVETHICVLQTIVDLQARGHQVFVPMDCVASRSADNKASGLAMATKAGAVVSNAESLMFYALQRAGTPQFKTLSRLIR